MGNDEQDSLTQREEAVNSASEPPESRQPQKGHVYCRHCGARIARDINYCPSCGEKTNVSPMTFNRGKLSKGAFILAERAKRLSRVQIIAVIGVIAAVVAAVLVGIAPTQIEQVVRDNAQELRSMMKDPSSFTIYGDIEVIEHQYDDGTSTTLVAIDYSGENSFGGTERDLALFDDGNYLGNYDDDADVSGYSSDAEIDEAMALASAKLTYLLADSDERTTVDGEKIARMISANYFE